MNVLKQHARKQKATRFLLIVSSLLLGVTVIAQALLFVSIVDHIFLKGAQFEEVVPDLISLLFVLVARSALTYWNGRAGVKMASRVKEHFRSQLVSKFSKNPLQASMRGQSGHKVSTVMDAVDEIDGYFSQYIPQVIQTSIVPIMILVVVSMEHFYSGLIMMITAPFIPLFYIIIGIMTKKKSEEQLDKMAIFSGRFLDTLQGLTTLKLFGRARYQKELIEGSSLDFRDATMEVLKIAFVSSLMLELISMLSIGLIALEIGLRLVLFQSITFSTAFFVLILAPEFYLFLKNLGQAFHTGRGSAGAAQKISDVLNTEDHPVQWGNDSIQNQEEPPSIRLEGVHFSYEAEGFALKDINITLPPYSQTAIVGKSGSGKTTLLHVLAGLVPVSEGSILVDGHKRSELKEEEWFDQISYISQSPYLFSGTIADNIAVGKKEEVSREAIEKAAEKAGIAPLVKSLEHGYDTPVGEGGRGLSGGEKQRLAIARAFLKQPTIILFDEPTTGLDLQTEKILQTSIQELSQSATVITVAHRLHTIKHADQILYMEDGRVLEQGTHTNLIEANPHYRNMVRTQQGGMAT